MYASGEGGSTACVHTLYTVPKLKVQNLFMNSNSMVKLSTYKSDGRVFLTKYLGNFFALPTQTGSKKETTFAIFIRGEIAD